jgi:hypothetical protein
MSSNESSSDTADMKTMIANPSANGGCLRRLVRRFLPGYHYQSGRICGNWSIEYWPGDEQWKHSVHLHWNWRGRRQWLCVFIPELRSPNDQAERPALETPPGLQQNLQNKKGGGTASDSAGSLQRPG